MDRLDKFYEGWLTRNDDFQRQALRLEHDSGSPPTHVGAWNRVMQPYQREKCRKENVLGRRPV
jgi:hypothetical protein